MPGVFDPFDSATPIDAEATLLWAIVLGAGMAVTSTAAAAWWFRYAMKDWRRDFMYKPGFPAAVNAALSLSRLASVYSIEVIVSATIYGRGCSLLGLITQAFDVFTSLMMLAMVWTTTSDAITVMVEYPTNLVSKEHLGELLRLSVGGALGIELDQKKLQQGIITEKIKKRKHHIANRAAAGNEPELQLTEEDIEAARLPPGVDAVDGPIIASELPPAGSKPNAHLRGALMDNPGLDSDEEQGPGKAPSAGGPLKGGATGAEDSASTRSSSVVEDRSWARKGLLRGGGSDDDEEEEGENAKEEEEEEEEEEDETEAGTEVSGDGPSEADGDQLEPEDGENTETATEADEHVTDSSESLTDEGDLENESTDKSDSLAESESDSDSSSSSSDDEEDKSVASSLLAGCFGFLCAESTQPAAKESRETRRAKRYQQRLAEMGLANAGAAQHGVTRGGKNNPMGLPPEALMLLARQASKGEGILAGRGGGATIAAPAPLARNRAMSGYDIIAMAAASASAGKDKPPSPKHPAARKEAKELEKKQKEEQKRLEKEKEERKKQKREEKKKAKKSGSGSGGEVSAEEATEGSSEAGDAEPASGSSSRAGSRRGSIAKSGSRRRLSRQDSRVSQRSSASRGSVSRQPSRSQLSRQNSATGSRARLVRQGSSVSNASAGSAGSGRSRAKSALVVASDGGAHAGGKRDHTGVLTLSYPARIAEMVRQVVARPLLVVTTQQLKEGYLRPASKFDCTNAKKFVTDNLRQAGPIKPARELHVGSAAFVLCGLLAALAGIIPFLADQFGFIGYTCAVKEGGPGLTAGKVFLLLTYYVPFWAMFIVSLMMNFFLRLVKGYSYPATPNGPHHVEVTIRRMSYYPLATAACFLFPSAHAYFFHQHSVQNNANEVYFAAIFVTWGLQFMAVAFAFGSVVVEMHVGMRDRSVVRGDPLSLKPKEKDDRNLEELPASQRVVVTRDSFWLLMNSIEERKHAPAAGKCARCNLHAHRLAVRVQTLRREAAARAVEAELTGSADAAGTNGTAGAPAPAAGAAATANSSSSAAAPATSAA